MPSYVQAGPSDAENGKRRLVGVLRRLIYLVTASFLVGLLTFAAALPDVRLGFTTLGVCIVGATWWVTRWLPARPSTLTEWRVAAVAALVFGLLIAIAIPSSRLPCDCPRPLGVGVCNCAIDHHFGARLAVASIGTVLALVLAVVAKRRASTALAA